jgi:hypothetical protein
MRIDYVRVWQRSNKISVGCDPADMPTKDYIERHRDIYTNPNITRWSEWLCGFMTFADISQTMAEEQVEG